LVVLKNTIFWDVMLCSMVDVYKLLEHTASMFRVKNKDGQEETKQQVELICEILPYGGGLASSDRAIAHALNSGNTGLSGITLTTSQAPGMPSPRTEVTRQWGNSIHRVQFGVLYVPMNNQCINHKQATIC
jgi:hypothetical protein